MIRSQSDVIEREVYIAARPETVFSFFVDPAKMVRWMGQRATLDPQPGGIYQVAINDTNIARGEFLEIVPYSRVVFTFGWEGGTPPSGASTVEIVLVPDGDGTRLHLRHHHLAAEEQVGHGEGWDHFIPRLIMVADGRDPGLDPWSSSGIG